MRLENPNVIHIDVDEMISLCERTSCSGVDCHTCPWSPGGNPSNRVVKIAIRDNMERAIETRNVAPFIVDISSAMIRDYCMMWAICTQLEIPDTDECDRRCPLNVYNGVHDGRELYVVIHANQHAQRE